MFRNRGPHSCSLCSDVPNIQDMTIRERMDAVRSNLSFIQEDDIAYDLTPHDPSQGRVMGRYGRTPQQTTMKVKQVLGDVGNNMKGIIHISHPAFDEGAGSYPSDLPERAAHEMVHSVKHPEEADGSDDSDDGDESGSEQEEDSDSDVEGEETYLDF